MKNGKNPHTATDSEPKAEQTDLLRYRISPEDSRAAGSVPPRLMSSQVPGMPKERRALELVQNEPRDQDICVRIDSQTISLLDTPSDSEIRSSS